MTALRLDPNDPALAVVLALARALFACRGRLIAPASSMRRLTFSEVAAQTAVMTLGFAEVAPTARPRYMRPDAITGRRPLLKVRS